MAATQVNNLTGPGATTAIQDATGSAKQVRFTFTGDFAGVTGYPQGSNDGSESSYVNLTGVRDDTGAAFNGTIGNTKCSITCNKGGWKYVRFNCTTISSGTLTVHQNQGAGFDLPLGTTPISIGSIGQAITSTSVNAFAVGPAGATSPTLNVDASAASCATGWNHIGAAAGGGAALTVLSSGANENGTIDAKGSGTLTLNGTATGNVVCGRLLVPNNGITSGASTLSIAGQAGTSSAGGSVSVTGGAGNGAFAGGAVSLTGGAGGAAGAGGAITLAGGVPASGNAAGGAAALSGGAGSGTGNGGALTLAGGASGAGATGNGGAVSIAAGAAVSTAGTGGAIAITAGLGTTTGPGGAIAMTSGAGGNASAGGTGAAGGVLGITGGAGGTTATGTGGAGSTVTITAGAGGTASGAGTGGAGGHVNLVPGAGGGTSGGTAGADGEIRFNGSGCDQACYSQGGLATPTATNVTFFLATRAYRIKSVSIIWDVAAGGVSTIDLFKDTGTNAIAGGTSILSAAQSINGTARTVVNPALTATAATLLLAAGDRLSLKYNHAIQSTSGLFVQVQLAPK